MGGTSKQTQNSETRQSSEFAPWDQAVAPVQDLIHNVRSRTGATNLSNTEQQAFGALQSNAETGNPYAGSIDSLAKTLFAGGGPDRTGMVQTAYNDVRKGMLPYTTMDTNPYSNEAFTKATGYLTQDIQDRINSQYAGAGYSPVRTGSYGGDLAEGVAKGVAPVWLQAYNDLEGRKMGAIQGLYSAGNQTAGILSGLDQTKLGNQQAGVGMAQSALNARDAPFMRMLELEQAKFATPAQRDAMLASLIVPMAQLGGSQTGISYGKQEGTKTMSDAEQAWGWMKAGGDLAKNLFGGAQGAGPWGKVG
jgi:hypothetical protein